jgi:pSer/pThr/pTyr-binding forkhead associated (FHA) protein
MTNKIYTVGRENADIVIANSEVSRLHLTLELIDSATVRVSDNNSTNGTYLEKKAGKVKISTETLSVDAPLLIAKYRTTSRELLAQLAASQDGSCSPPKQTKTEPFSRYIRSATGEFKGK